MPSLLVVLTLQKIDVLFRSLDVQFTFPLCNDISQICYGLAKLLVFLSHSPYGPFILNDFCNDICQICYGLAKLLAFLSHSPYGPVVLNDFRREQFVRVDGDIKLTDVDDMGFQERTCLRDNDCTVTFPSTNFTLRWVVYECYTVVSNAKLWQSLS